MISEYAQRFILETLDYIEDQIRHPPTDRHPIRFDMNFWTQHISEFRLRDLREQHMIAPYIGACDSVACLAGHMAVRLGWKWNPHENESGDYCRLKDFPEEHPLHHAATQAARLYGRSYQGAEALVSLPTAVQAYLNLTAAEWRHLTNPRDWPPRFAIPLKEEPTELGRVEITRQRVLAWIENPLEESQEELDAEAEALENESDYTDDDNDNYLDEDTDEENDD